MLCFRVHIVRVLVLATLVSIVAPSTAHARISAFDPPRPVAVRRLVNGRTFAFAIGDGCLSPAGLARLRDYDIVVVDAEEAAPAQVSALRASGCLVLGYLSVGTVEPWRSWYPRVAAYRLEPLDDWDEYYADASAPGYRAQIDSIAAGLLAEGYDGLFLDNVDMVETHPEQTAGMRTLVGALGVRVRARGGVLFAQNGWGFCSTLAPRLDGWNREDVVGTYDFDAQSYRRTSPGERADALEELRAARAAGVRTTTTDYTAEGDRSTVRRGIYCARLVGAVPYASDIGLSRIP